MALKLTRTDIQNKGLDYVRSLNEFILVVEDWEPNDNPSSYWIEKQGFLYRENMSPNRNGPITYYYYSKQTQEEKDLEPLGWIILGARRLRKIPPIT